MEDDFVSKETLQPRDRFTAPGQTGGVNVLSMVPLIVHVYGVKYLDFG